LVRREVIPELHQREVCARQGRFADVNPADGSVIAEVTEADHGMVDDAVQAARKALRGEWGRLGSA
jgi:aminomuconate-semialdehyde/2-hydroxymuconate-6-semialdehyde dehydrogenase